MTLHTEKYKQAILYLCSKLGKEVRGKKKLAKLLYFVDFDFFEKNQKYFTGDKYKALPMGPFPVSLSEITREMAKEKTLKIESVREHNGYNATEIYTCLKDPKTSAFSKEEKEMLDRVIIKYGHLNGKQLEDLTHAEAPFSGTKQNEEIFYELAFYRGTNFKNND
ncbi:SocA family protein [Patescibacteria group bacterium]|nr:SocA family protein [Patescibacteria group bacterium]